MKKSEVDFIVKVLERNLMYHKDDALKMRTEYYDGFSKGYEAAVESLKNMLEVVE